MFIESYYGGAVKMYKTDSKYTELALTTIEKFLNKKSLEGVEKYKKMEELKKPKACFVSIHSNGYLRGCIGTIFPFRDSLYDEIVGNAIAACSEDPRFIPMTAEELEEIEISVDVLSEPQIVHSVEELDPKKYGIIVSDGKNNKGVLLPDLEGIDTVEEQIAIAKAKAGLKNVEMSRLEIYRFSAVRYR